MTMALFCHEMKSDIYHSQVGSRPETLVSGQATCLSPEAGRFCPALYEVSE